jgi:uncharacterized repeat protein (TIGR02543 family)
MCVRATCGHIVKVLIATAIGGAQAQNLVDTLLDNSEKLQTTVTLDRSVYFPDEAAVVTISVVNPTAAALQVFAPFTMLTGCLEVYASPLLPGSTDPICESLVDATTPTTIMQPGEQRQVTLNSYENQFDRGLPAMYGGSAPRQAGSFVLGYGYWNANPVPFQVELPHLEAAAVVRVADVTDIDETGKDIQFPGYRHAFAVEWQGQTFICVTRGASRTSSPVTPDANGDLEDPPEIITRIATSANPVVSLTVTADAAGNLTINWQDAEGNQQTATYPGPPMPARTAVGITTVPPGLSISVDGVAYTTPHTFQWVPGTMHSLDSGVSGIDSGGQQYAWLNWSDDLKTSHEIFAPAAATTYTAYFDMSYALTLAVSPAHAGHITPMETAFSPGFSIGLYPPGSPVKLSASPVSGYTFSGWTGPVADPASAETSVPMDRPQTVTAHFMANVATPQISPSGGTYITPPVVALTTATQGASIRYTLDGSTPTATSGTVYTGHTGGITLKTTTKIKAIAYANGMVDSEIATDNFIIEPLAGPPLFSPAAGKYPVAQTVTLFSLTAGTSINYTLDGSTPSPAIGTLYTGPISVQRTTTIRAIAFGSGMAASGINSATYTIGAVAMMTSPASPAREQYERLKRAATVEVRPR